MTSLIDLCSRAHVDDDTTARARRACSTILARAPVDPWDARAEASRMLATVCAAARVPYVLGAYVGTLRDALVGLEWIASRARERNGGRLHFAVAVALAMLSRLVTRGRYVHRTARGFEASDVPTIEPTIYAWGKGAAANDC